VSESEENELYRRAMSFRYAFAGWWYVLRTQRNAWIHALATIAVVLLASWLRVSNVEWAVLVLAITIVWTAEIFNTGLEALVDLASPEFHMTAKIAKDVAAGAVLAAACGAAITGLIIMGPPLLEKLSG
jgi:diacylglycerol kinase (ATP)